MSYTTNGVPTITVRDTTVSAQKYMFVWKTNGEYVRFEVDEAQPVRGVSPSTNGIFQPSERIVG